MSHIYKVEKLHPESLKHLIKGHPWITRDSFSSRWPSQAVLLHINFRNPSPQTYTFIHDPKHHFCVARKIAEKKINTLEELEQLIKTNLQKSIDIRIQQKILNYRNHFYLSFGETDFLPGLFIIYLNGKILIQSQMSFWDDKIKKIIHWTEEFLKERQLNIDSFWWQKRQLKQEPAKLFKAGNFITDKQSFIVNELNFSMNVTLGDKYDHGIYTDMANIRFNLASKAELFKDKSVLNLFSYTGAYSIFALTHGASYCTSVDVSSTYQKILEANLVSNQIEVKKHQSLTMDIVEALKKVHEQKKRYDFIILDPPSSYTSNKRKVQAFVHYPELLKLIEKITTTKAYLLCFLNYHQKTKNQFSKMISTALPGWTTIEAFSMNADTPVLPYFPEGDYLKAVLLTQKKSLF